MSRWLHAAIAAVFFISPLALAKDTTEESKLCVQFLTRPNVKPIDYAASDLEGLFFDLIKKVQAANEVESAHAVSYVKEVLALKAQILNNVFRLLPTVEKPETLDSIYQMLETLGIPPKSYGLVIDKQNRITRKGPSFKLEFPPPEEPGPSIGFVNFGKNETRDLPDWLHRSIGFGPQHVELDAPPPRATGSIHRTVSENDPRTLIITDGETNTTYKVDLRVLSIFGFELDNHRYQLEFNPEVYSWVVTDENLSNPSGKIGF